MFGNGAHDVVPQRERCLRSQRLAASRRASEVDVINLAALPTDAVGDIPEDHYSGPWVIQFTVS